MTTALAFALAAEALLLGCAAAAGILHWTRRRRRLEEQFAAAEADARRVALNTRILDASAAELSELVLEHALRDLDLGDPPLRDRSRPGPTSPPRGPEPDLTAQRRPGIAFVETPTARRARRGARGRGRPGRPRGRARPLPDHAPAATSSSATTGLTAVCHTTACEPYSAIDQALSTTWWR